MSYKSIAPLFIPKSVAIIGASRKPGKIGHVIMQNFSGGKYKGKLFPINPETDYIFGFKCYKSILEINSLIDLVIISVKAKLVPIMLEQCCKKRVKSAIIVSAGFDEIGNKKLSDKIKYIISKHKTTRVLGPNCLGILNSKNGVDTLFLPRYRLARPKQGGIAFVSQSGAVGSATLDWASSLEYGISKFISYGNAYDIDESDLIEYLAHDKETKVIVVYIEGLKDGRKFFKVAKKYARKKPIIVLKGGKTSAGNIAVKSHTASLAGNYAVFKAACKQTGLIEAINMRELFDFARVFSYLEKPKGNKIQIITDGGGYGVMTADAISDNNLQLAKMQSKNINKIKKAMPDYVVLGNPIDLTGDANNTRYKLAVETALSDSNVDILIVIVLFQVPAITSEIVEVLSELNKKSKKPMIAISLGGEFSEVHTKAIEREGIVCFSHPYAAVKALAVFCDFYLK